MKNIFYSNTWHIQTEIITETTLSEEHFLSYRLLSVNWSYGPEAYTSGRMSLIFDWWPRNTIGHLFCTTSNFVHNFVAIYELGLELRSGNAKIGAFLHLGDLDLWPLTLTFAWTSLLPVVITKITLIQWREHSEKAVTGGWTDGQMDWTIHRNAWSQVKTDWCIDLQCIKQRHSCDNTIVHGHV